MPPRPKELNLPTVPQARDGGCGKPRPSRVGKWRALVLIGVHVFFVGHFIHWQLAGKTLSPLEPSEAMQTLEQGLVNCGFVVLLVGVLSTLVLGRWFCGWGCHIIALQDLCTWICRKLRFRPKPFRSRLLIFVPLLAGLYMFVWPSVARAWAGHPPPALLYHFTTYDFWATFPGPIMSAVSLAVCGLLIVLLLGNKGYCTYACPYGGLFGVADRFAVGRIRVTDDCDQCGHCTSTCTSNVRVHEEVRLHGMVVSPGCMKCTDCISVCPKDALYFGFGRPSAARGSARAPRPRREFDYAWPEEVALAAVFLVALYAYRGLYDAVPFLLALGMASITAYLLVQAARLFYADSVRVHVAQLKLKRRLTRTGWAYVGLALVLAVFVGHSAVLQFHVREGERMLDRATALQAAFRPDAPEVVEASRAALDHFRWIHRFGLLPQISTEVRLGSLYLFLGESELAEPHLRRALQIDRDYGAARYKWAELLARRGDTERGIAELRAAVEADPGLTDARNDLVAVLVQRGERDEALRVAQRIVQRRPADVDARLGLARLLADSGKREAAEVEMREVVRQRPRSAAARLQLGLLLADLGRGHEAVEEVTRAAELDATNPRIWFVLGVLAASAGESETARSALERARQVAPFDREVLRAWATETVRSGRYPAVKQELTPEAGREVAAAYALAHLLAAAGDAEGARSAFERVRGARPDLLPP